ncbi:MAG: SurA N-terminal domain-containing protein [Candidatus Brocadiaceae bacterium]
MVSSSWFRRHQKTVYIVMIFAMFVWGISYSVMELIPKKPIGRILGRKITQNEFADMVSRWQRLFFSQAKESVVSLVWKQLTLVEEAKKMGLVVTNQELEEGLQRLGFQIFGGQENINRYMLIQFLCSSFRLNQEQIARTLQEALLVEKLDGLMRSSIKATSDELWQRYSMENEQIKFKALTLKANDFLDLVNVTEDEIRDFYEKYKNTARNPGSGNPGYKYPEMVKVECLIAKYDDMEKRVSVLEEEMKKYYEDNKETQFKITAEQKQEEKKPQKDTAQTDKKSVKEEKKTADDVKSKEEKKLTAAYKPFTEVKMDIQKTLLRQKAMEKVTELTTKADEEIYETMDKAERPSFKDIANRYKLLYEIPKGKKSGSEFLSEEDLTEVFPGSGQLVQVSFGRDKFEPSTPLDFVEGKLILQVIDKKPAAAPPLEDIRNEVMNDLKMEKGLLKAKEIAEKYAGATSVPAFDEVMKSIKAEYPQKNISACETGYINRPIKVFNKDSRYIEALKEDRPNVAKKAFELKTGQWGVAMETSGEKACYIISLVEKKQADKAAFEKDKENVAKRYAYEKQEAFMTEWQNDLGKHVEVYARFQ